MAAEYQSSGHGTCAPRTTLLEELTGRDGKPNRRARKPVKSRGAMLARRLLARARMDYRLVLVLLATALGCNRSALTAGSPSDGSVPADAAPPDAAPPDASPPSSCAGLSECDCYRAAGCEVRAEACWCPFPECDPNGACVCGGGKFIGCVPAGAMCPQISCGLVGTASPDTRGCLQCDAPPDCNTARARLQTNCNFAAEYIAGLSCAKNPSCVAECLDALERCEDVTCDFCSTCDCGGQTTSFTQCYAACGA
jgi:hypothetical protein